MPYATIDDLVEVEPTILDYGVLDWDSQLAQSETEINRVISVRWWPQYQKQLRVDITIRGDFVLIDTTKLDPTQWTKATVYHALAYHIAPKLTKFEDTPDRFEKMMTYYQGRFEHEMDLAIREGVRYDLDLDGTFSPDERQPDTYLRIRR
jgi:hypothetical protein